MRDLSAEFNTVDVMISENFTIFSVKLDVRSEIDESFVNLSIMIHNPHNLMSCVPDTGTPMQSTTFVNFKLVCKIYHNAFPTFFFPVYRQLVKSRASVIPSQPGVLKGPRWSQKYQSQNNCQT